MCINMYEELFQLFMLVFMHIYNARNDREVAYCMKLVSVYCNFIFYLE